MKITIETLKERNASERAWINKVGYEGGQPSDVYSYNDLSYMEDAFPDGLNISPDTAELLSRTLAPRFALSLRNDVDNIIPKEEIEFVYRFLRDIAKTITEGVSYTDHILSGEAPDSRFEQKFKNFCDKCNIAPTDSAREAYLADEKKYARLLKLLRTDFDIHGGADASESVLKVGEFKEILMEQERKCNAVPEHMRVIFGWKRHPAMIHNYSFAHIHSDFAAFHGYVTVEVFGVEPTYLVPLSDFYDTLKVSAENGLFECIALDGMTATEIFSKL